MFAFIRGLFFFALLSQYTVISQRTMAGYYNTEWLNETVENNDNFFVGGMPLGNGDTAVLAWANATAGGVSLYVSKQNALANDASNYKVALLTLFLSPNPFSLGGNWFNQTLDISTGTVFLQVGGTADVPAASFSVWVDATSNTVYVGITGGDAQQQQQQQQLFTITAAITPIRPTGYAAYAAPWKCTKTSSAPDVVVDPLPPTAPFPSPATLVILHENLPSDRPEGSLINTTLTTQSLAGAIGTVPDVFTGRRFGVAVDAVEGTFERTTPLTLTSVAPVSFAVFRVTVRSTQGETTRDTWVDALGVQTSAAPSAPPRTAHVAWWQSFWASTWVDIDTDSSSDGFKVSQTYAMSRYMNNAQSRVVTVGGSFDQQPVKFNGLAWTSKRPNATGPGCAAGLGPDCREWGNENWWQNVRCAYWPMIQDGDYQQLDVLLLYYLRSAPFLRARAQALLPNATAYPDMLWQTETSTVFGAFTEVDWVGSSTNACSTPRPDDLPPFLQNNPFVYLDAFGDGPTGELGLFILDVFLYDNNATAFATRLPWIFGALDYFTYKFFKNGVVNIAPTQACETYWSLWPITNTSERVEGDAPTIAVVTRLLERTLSEVPRDLLPLVRLQAYTKVLAAMPALPLSGPLLAPAIFKNGKMRNSESVAMYSVHPTRHFSVGRLLTGGVASLTQAVATFYADPNSGGSPTGNDGWHQGTMHAPLLGLRNETAALLVNRTTGKPLPGYRLKFFSGEDGMGDEAACEAFSNLASGVQFALLQPGEQGAVVLFPGWPCTWDVHFKLRAPMNTTIEGVWKGGKLFNLTVVPESRTPWVQIAPGC